MEFLNELRTQELINETKSRLAAKQDTLTFDNVPTENSDNPVKSGGVYSANQNIYEVMGQNSAKNFIPFDLDRIKAKNTTGTWNGNVYSLNGIDFTFNSDGTVNASGTATETASVHYYDPIGLPPFGGDRILRLTGCPSGGSGTTYKVMAYRANAVDGSTGTAEEYGDGISLKWLNNGSGIKAFVSISVYTGAGTIDITFKPMLRLSTDTDNTFAPYAKTNQELTAENKALTNQVNVYGSKNVLDLTPRLKKKIPTGSAIVSFSNEGIVLNGTVSTSGNIRICPAEDDNSFVLPQGIYVLSHKDGASPSGTGITLRKNGTDLTTSNRLANPYEFEANGTDYFTILFHESAVTFNNAVVCPMICLKSFYELDTSFEPYAKTNQQLTEDTTALLDNAEVNGAVNMLPIDLNYIKANNSASSWSGNACTHNGVTYTIDEANGKITVNGTASERSTLQVYNAIAGDLFKKGFKYLAKVFNNNFNTVNGYYVQLYMTNSPYTRIDAFTGNNFVVPDSFFDNSIRVSIQIVVENGKSVDNQVITPLIAFGNYTGGFEKYAKSNKELTEDVEEVQINLNPTGKRCFLAFYSPYDGWLGTFATSFGISKSTTLRQLCNVVCSSGEGSVWQEAGEIVITTNSASVDASNTPLYLQTIANDFNVTGILEIRITIINIGSGRLYVEVKDKDLTYVKRAYYNNFTLASTGVKTQTL